MHLYCVIKRMNQEQLLKRFAGQRIQSSLDFPSTAHSPSPAFGPTPYTPQEISLDKNYCIGTKVVKAVFAKPLPYL